MLVSATAFPFASSASIAVAWLVAVNVFAALPWGAAAAAAALFPARLRGQGAALYFLVVGIVSSTLGPTSVALLTDHVFHDPQALRWSLAIVNVIGMTAAMALLWAALPAYRRVVE